MTMNELEEESGGGDGFVNFYRSLPRLPETTIRFFERSDYYTAHGDCAMFIAKHIFRTLGGIKYMGSKSEKLPYLCLGNTPFANVVKELLLVRQYRIETYVPAKGRDQWTLSRKASPGNLQAFEDTIFNGAADSSSSVIMAVRTGLVDGQRTVGVAYCDVSAARFGVIEFVDSDQFSTLEGVLVQLGAKECLIAVNEHQGVRLVVDRSSMLVTELKTSQFKTVDIVQDLDRLLKMTADVSPASLPELEMKLVMGSVAALILYLELTSQESGFGQYKLEKFDTSQFMRLDSAAVAALHLQPSPQDQGNKTMCLSGILNKCKTQQGKRLLSQWVKQPLLSKPKIDERLNLVATFVDDAALRMAIADDGLRHMPDFDRISKKFQRDKATLEDAVKVYQAVGVLPQILAALQTVESEHTTLINEVLAEPVSVAIEEFEKFQGLIESTINLEAVENHTFMVKDAYDPELGEIKAEMDEVEESFQPIAKAAARTLGMELGKELKLEFEARHGRFLRVTRANEKHIRNKPAFRTIETQKAGVKFTNTELARANDQFGSLSKRYHNKQAAIVSEILGIAGGYSAAMETLNMALAHLDVICSFGTVAATAPIPYVRPTITPMGGDIVLCEARHPCVEVQDDVSFIANDVALRRGSSEFAVITGPNMGGKSTYIRQVGVNVLMAQIGSFVPCSSAEVSICDSILARVGAGDSQLKGVSTFMAEMLETASILKSASANSLIIIDELGRGTSTYDGFGLAWAISEHIITKIGAFCLFATHFHELTGLAKEHAAASNLHVTAHAAGDALTLLYQVEEGICDQSFGINVAIMAKFPEEVVEHAKRKAEELEDFQSNGESPQRMKLAHDMIADFMAQANEATQDAVDDDERLARLRKIMADLGPRIEEAGLQ